MKVAGLVLTVLSVIVGVLQLVHAWWGVGVEPVSVVTEVYRTVTDSDLRSDPGGASSDDLSDSSRELDERMDEMIEEFSDTAPPTPPKNLRVAEQEQCVVLLEWDPSTDDEELSGYRVFARGSVGGRVDERFTEFEVRLFPGDTETFKVGAFDGSGNESELSNEITVSC